MQTFPANSVGSEMSGKSFLKERISRYINQTSLSSSMHMNERIPQLRLRVSLHLTLTVQCFLRRGFIQLAHPRGFQPGYWLTRWCRAFKGSTWHSSSNVPSHLPVCHVATPKRTPTTPAETAVVAKTSHPWFCGLKGKRYWPLFFSLSRYSNTDA